MRLPHAEKRIKGVQLPHSALFEKRNKCYAKKERNANMAYQKLSEEEKQRRKEERKAARLSAEAEAQEAQENEKADEASATNDEVEKPEPEAEKAAEKEPQASRTYSAEEVQALIESAVQSALSKQQPQVVQISAETPVVHLMFQDACSPDNYIQFGVGARYGSITGSFGLKTVTKEQFLGDFRDAFVQLLLAERKLIVLDGLTDEERVAYGVDYKDGEFLTERQFRNMLTNTDALLEAYPKLCDGYKQMVATQITTAFEKKDPRVTRKLVAALNKLSKKDGQDSRGDFAHVLEAMKADEL